MLEKMIQELTYLFNKYSAAEWRGDPNARRLVDLVAEDRAGITLELEDVRSRRSVLSDHDFLGPRERAQRRAHLNRDVATADVLLAEYLTAANADPGFAHVFDKMAVQRRWERRKKLFAARDAREQDVSPLT